MIIIVAYGGGCRNIICITYIPLFMVRLNFPCASAKHSSMILSGALAGYILIVQPYVSYRILHT